MKIPDSFLVLLRIPVPPALLPALLFALSDDDLDDVGRYVGLWWCRHDKRLVVHIGTAELHEPYGSSPWDLFRRHPAVAPHLAPYHIGDTGGPSTHALVLDRSEKRFYVGPVAEVRTFLYAAAKEEGLVCQRLLAAFDGALMSRTMDEATYWLGDLTSDIINEPLLPLDPAEIDAYIEEHAEELKQLEELPRELRRQLDDYGFRNFGPWPPARTPRASR